MLLFQIYCAKSRPQLTIIAVPFQGLTDSLPLGTGNRDTRKSFPEDRAESFCERVMKNCTCIWKFKLIFSIFQNQLESYEMPFRMEKWNFYTVLPNPISTDSAKLGANSRFNLWSCNSNLSSVCSLDDQTCEAVARFTSVLTPFYSPILQQFVKFFQKIEILYEPIACIKIGHLQMPWVKRVTWRYTKFKLIWIRRAIKSF